MTKYLKILAIILLLLAAVLCFSGCGKDSVKIDYTDNPINMETNEDAIENLTVPYDYELTSLNPSYVSYIPDQEFMTNIYDTLTAIDKYGEVIPSVATSWEHSDDYKTWTFHLRDDCYWVNYKGEIVGTVKAQDFVTGLEFATNYVKSEGRTAYISNDIIAGASDYYNYTMSISEEEALSLNEKDFTDMVGISAPDDSTVVIETQEACSFLPSVVTSSAFIPLSKEHLDDVGIDNYIINSYQTAWFNGPYVLTEYIKDNVRVIDANPHWYGNKDHTRFKSVTYKCVEDSSMEYQLYQNNELDLVTLSQSQIKRIMDDKDSKYYGKTITRKSEGTAGFFIFNFDKADDENWNRAVANTAFRQTFVYGLDNYPICQYYNRANPKAIDVKTLQTYGGGKLSDGTEYKDLVISLLDYDEGEDGTYVKNRKLFEKYKKQAIRELSAQGVTFPVNIDFFAYEASEASINYARIFKTMLERSLGSDFVTVTIKTYSSSYFTEVVDKRLASICDAGYAYDFADPSNIMALFKSDSIESTYYQYNNAYRVLEKENHTGKNAYRRELVSLIKKYDKMYEEANKICDNDERLKAFAELEEYAIENAIYAVPCFNQSTEMLTNIDEDSLSISSVSGYDYRYVDMKTHKQK